MYEEKKRSNKSIHWLSALIKLALIFLVVFAVWYFIIKRNGNKNNTKKLGASMSDNISYLKKQYTKYFNINNIPETIDEESKVYLKELVESKNSKTIYDKNGEECSTSSSYGKLVKTKDDNYELKVYLKCKNEADSELFTITHKEIIDTNDTKNDNKKNNDTKNVDDKKTKDTNNKVNTDDKNTNKNNNVNNTKKNNTNNSSDNGSTKYVQQKTNTQSSTVNKNTTNTNSNASKKTTTQSTSSQSTSTTTKTTTTTATVVEKEINVSKITSDPNRIVLTEYLLYKLGKGSYTVPDGKHIVYYAEVPYYKYCNNNDMQNCHTGFAKIPANEQAINDLLSYGYTEYLDYTETVPVYIPIIEEIWSSSKEKEGYIYSGESRTHYRVN